MRRMGPGVAVVVATAAYTVGSEVTGNVTTVGGSDVYTFTLAEARNLVAEGADHTHRVGGVEVGESGEGAGDVVQGDHGGWSFCRCACCAADSLNLG